MSSSPSVGELETHFRCARALLWVSPASLSLSVPHSLAPSITRKIKNKTFFQEIFKQIIKHTVYDKERPIFFAYHADRPQLKVEKSTLHTVPLPPGGTL